MSDTSDNLPEVTAGLNRWLGRVDTAAGSAMSLIARQIFIDAKKNADSAKNPPTRINGRLYYHPHIGPRNGEGPNRGTGNLLTSMTFSSSRKGFGTYTAQVGAGAVYARALELGNPRWTSGVKYPYMQPALNGVVSSGKLSQILAYSFRSLGG
jgi:hypothetical protein